MHHLQVPRDGRRCPKFLLLLQAFPLLADLILPHQFRLSDISEYQFFETVLFLSD